MVTAMREKALRGPEHNSGDGKCMGSDEGGGKGASEGLGCE